jgi:hypothetical protein
MQRISYINWKTGEVYSGETSPSDVDSEPGSILRETVSEAFEDARAIPVYVSKGKMVVPSDMPKDTESSLKVISGLKVDPKNPGSYVCKEQAAPLDPVDVAVPFENGMDIGIGPDDQPYVIQG